jgi:HEPN domain-containing protein
VQLWLERARADLGGARVLVKAMDPDTQPWLAAFHAQQAAEKAIKALLAANSIQPPQIHSLVALRAMLPPGTDLGVSHERLTILTDFAVAVRYVPDLTQSEDPTWTDAESAIGTAQAILDAVTAQIRGN